VTCPICAKETDAKYRPFCSRRCADIDLGRWLNESYSVPPAKTTLTRRPHRAVTICRTDRRAWQGRNAGTLQPAGLVRLSNWRFGRLGIVIRNSEPDQAACFA